MSTHSNDSDDRDSASTDTYNGGYATQSDNDEGYVSREASSTSSEAVAGVVRRIKHAIDSLALHHAVLDGDLLLVLRRVRSKNINYRDAMGCTPLDLAATANRVDIAAALLDKGARLLPDKSFSTPLHEAARKGYADMLLLLKEYASTFVLNAANQDGKTALQLAVDGGHHQAMRRLLEAGDDIDCTSPKLLASAMERGDLEAVRLLCTGRVNERNSKEKTPLHVAAAANNGQMVELLLGLGAQVLVRDGIKMSSQLATDQALKKRLSALEKAAAVEANSAADAAWADEPESKNSKNSGKKSGARNPPVGQSPATAVKNAGASGSQPNAQPQARVVSVKGKEPQPPNQSEKQTEVEPKPIPAPLNVMPAPVAAPENTPNSASDGSLQGGGKSKANGKGKKRVSLGVSITRLFEKREAQTTRSPSSAPSVPVLSPAPPTPSPTEPLSHSTSSNSVVAPAPQPVPDAPARPPHDECVAIPTYEEFCKIYNEPRGLAPQCESFPFWWQYFNPKCALGHPLTQKNLDSLSRLTQSR